jgi:hypothetical protein
MLCSASKALLRSSAAEAFNSNFLRMLAVTTIA